MRSGDIEVIEIRFRDSDGIRKVVSFEIGYGVELDCGDGKVEFDSNRIF